MLACFFISNSLHRKILAIFLFAFFISAIDIYAQKYVNKAKKNISKDKYEEAIQMLREGLVSDKDNPEAYYYIGRAYQLMAKKSKVVSDKYDLYQKMRIAYDKALVLNEGVKKKKPKQIVLLEEVELLGLWQEEFNSGVRHLQAENADYHSVINHLKNATAILPDSGFVYDVIAQLYGEQQNYEDGLKYVDLAIENNNKPDFYSHLRKINYLNYTNQEDSRVKEIEHARTLFPDSVLFIEMLTDSYVTIGEYDKAIGLLEDLIGKDPNNIAYHIALGGQWLHIADQKDREWRELSDKIFDLRNVSTEQEIKQKNELHREEEQIYEEIEQAGGNAIDIFDKILEIEFNNASVYYNLSHAYLSQSIRLSNRQLILENDQEFSEEEIKKLLAKAKQYGEKVIEIDESYTDVWTILSQVYLRLGMNDEATEAMKKASQ